MIGGPVVLAYHGVARVPRSSDPDKLMVSPERLRAHIKVLKRARYSFGLVEDLIVEGAVPRPNGRLAFLTFDDGWANWVSEALEVLRSEGVVASFFVCPGWWDGRQHPGFTGPQGKLLDREGVMELAQAGMGVGSHSMTHPDLRKIGDDELFHELAASKSALEELTGEPCRTLAYPYGLYDDRVMMAAERAGYDLALDWLPGRWRPYAIPRLPAPSHAGAWKLLLKLLGLRRPGR